MIGFGFAWLIGPGIFRGNCLCGNFKGRYAGRIGGQDWKSLNFVPVQRSTPFPPTCKPHHGRIFFFFFFFFCSKVVWLIGPGIFRGNCPFGSFKGRYAGRIGRQNWKSFNFFPVIEKVPLSHSRVNPTTCFSNHVYSPNVNPKPEAACL